jgi:hypothetical protein
VHENVRQRERVLNIFRGKHWHTGGNVTTRGTAYFFSSRSARSGMFSEWMKIARCLEESRVIMPFFSRF